jgi:Big-like domain-containing protein
MPTSLIRTLVLALALAATAASAQAPQRHATNVTALLAHPSFYHLRPIIIVGTTALLDNGELRVNSESGAMRVVFKGGAPEGLNEIRGELWDLGRMNPDEPRLTNYDLKTVFHLDPEGPWPRPGQVMALVASAISPSSPPPAPTIRAMVLYPSRYLEQRVTVVGQFAGRNLLGDLPDAPARSRYDFVLRSVDAAIWVTNIQPRGRDFDLALDARIDTGRWLEVTGTLQQGRGLQWLEAQPGSLKIAKPPAETTSVEPQIRVPAAPPPEVVFSAPTQDETDVLVSANVRIQFSRDIDPATLKGRLRAQYIGSALPAGGEPPLKLEFTTEYRPATRVLEIRFSQPIERFRTVQIDLLEGVLGTDQQPLAPWTLKFMTGGS